MLADLVSASGGVPDQDSGIGLVASFEQACEAFRAAKRIQWSVLEYSQQQPENCLGAAIAVYHSSDLPHGNHGEAAQGITALLEQAKPSQIFLSRNATKMLQSVPGLQLRKRSGPSLAASELEREAQELIWTTPQTQRRVQELLKQAARKVNPKSEPALTSEPTVDISSDASRPTAAQIHASLFSVDRPPALDPSEIVPNPPAQRAAEPQTGRSSNLLWWLIPGIGVPTALAALFFLAQTPKRPVLPESPAFAERPSVNPAPEHRTPTPKPPPAPERPQPRAHEDSSTVGSTKPALREHASRPTEGLKVTEYEGFSERDIPALLRLADGQAGAGRYEDARRGYDIVLHLDPNNAAARQGIRKLNLSEQDSR